MLPKGYQLNSDGEPAVTLEPNIMVHQFHHRSQQYTHHADAGDVIGLHINRFMMLMTHRNKAMFLEDMRTIPFQQSMQFHHHATHN